MSYATYRHHLGNRQPGVLIGIRGTVDLLSGSQNSAYYFKPRNVYALHETGFGLATVVSASDADDCAQWPVTRSSHAGDFSPKHSF
jgi:hypothetical protein